ncbi:MAG: DUF4132 domain-containing protein [Microscillaceae bacterium]|jgi:hypothetical protein|nr:DUF4132 domain-containing protein [Microscillaceae bacterium]
MQKETIYFQKSKKWDFFRQTNFDFVGEREYWYRFFSHGVDFPDFYEARMDWLGEAVSFVKELGIGVFETFLLAIVEEYAKDMNNWFRSDKTEFLKGLLFICHHLKTDICEQFILKTTDKAFSKLPSRGSASRIVGTFGLDILAFDADEVIFAKLLEMKIRTKNPVFREELDYVLHKLKLRLELDEETVLDKSVSDFGVVEGVLEQTIGDFTAQVQIENYHKFTLEWLKADKTVQKSEPTILKKQFAAELKQFKATLQDLKQALLTHKNRLENSWRLERVWTWETWHKYFWQHPVMRFLTENLLWEFEKAGKTTTGLPQGDKIIDGQGKTLAVEGSWVRLWHPVQSSAEDTLAWRNYIFDNQLVQPFKQAFREVYLVTEAELATATYSNRFSAHILRQNTLWALTRQRAWDYGGKFSYDNPKIALPEYNLEVTLEVESDFEFAITQRVQFKALETPAAVYLKDIHPIAFSEAMRDIDLFVAVCSIGNDPSWNENLHYQAYWQDYAYGEKSETISAKNRLEILQKVIPRLKIAPQCSFEGNFLVVKGKIRTYKINLGSSNILMKPNDEYLCIVADRSRETNAQPIYLPFDGDSILSLVLSKAFLLAEDDKIQDPTILSQIY